jgi:hypothetical protein
MYILAFGCECSSMNPNFTNRLALSYFWLSVTPYGPHGLLGSPWDIATFGPRDFRTNRLRDHGTLGTMGLWDNGTMGTCDFGTMGPLDI